MYIYIYIIYIYNFGKSRSKTKSATGVPFVVTYHPRLKALSKIIHENLNLYI